VTLSLFTRDYWNESVLLGFFKNYGWLLFFLLGCLILLFSANILSFGLYGRSMCRMSGGFVCKGPVAAETEISFTIFNGKPLPVKLVSVALLDTSCAQVFNFEEPRMMERGEFQRVVFKCYRFPRVTESEIEIKYISIRSDLIYGDKGKIKLSR
jgi:hypothetical protein